MYVCVRVGVIDTTLDQNRNCVSEKDRKTPVKGKEVRHNKTT